MTGQQLSDTLRVIGWSANEASRRLSIHSGRFNRMLKGAEPVPAAAAAWLVAVQRAVEALPPPRGL